MLANTPPFLDTQLNPIYKEWRTNSQEIHQELQCLDFWWSNLIKKLMIGVRVKNTTKAYIPRKD